MDVMNALQGEGGVIAIARELGVDESTAQSGVAALLPAVMGGMQNQAEAHPQGLGGCCQSNASPSPHDAVRSLSAAA